MKYRKNASDIQVLLYQKVVANLEKIVNLRLMSSGS